MMYFILGALLVWFSRIFCRIYAMFLIEIGMTLFTVLYSQYLFLFAYIFTTFCVLPSFLHLRCFIWGHFLDARRISFSIVIRESAVFCLKMSWFNLHFWSTFSLGIAFQMSVLFSQHIGDIIACFLAFLDEKGDPRLAPLKIGLFRLHPCKLISSFWLGFVCYAFVSGLTIMCPSMDFFF